MDDKLTELERRIDRYMHESMEAEKVALDKLVQFPKPTNPVSPLDILKRERVRHHTRTLTLREVKKWIQELRNGEPPREVTET